VKKVGAGFILSVWIASAIFLCPTPGPAQAPAGPAAATAPTPAAPAIEPAALERLKKMSDALKGAESFRFTARTLREQRSAAGPMLDFYMASRVAVARPNRVRVDSSGDVVSASLWYDGKTVTILSGKSAFYGQAEAPPTIDETLRVLSERLQTPLPVAGFLVKDPYARMIEGVKVAFEVGPVRIDGVACHHFVFSEEDADWQIWIEDGDRPVPRRLAVVYKKIEGSPRVVTAMSDWNLSASIPASEFAFQAPAGAKKVDWATGQK